MDFLSFIPIVKEIIGLFPSEQKRQELLAKVQDFEAQVAQGQLEVNKVEAANASLFVAGWRPAVGWLCVAGLAYNIVAAPMGLPKAETDVLMSLLVGMLGMGGLRTFEKVKGVATRG